MSVLACFPGKGPPALSASDELVLQWKAMHTPARYTGSPADDLPYSSSEEDTPPQKAARGTAGKPEDEAQAPGESLTSSQQTTETSGTAESDDTTGTSRVQGGEPAAEGGLRVPGGGRLAAVQENSAEGFDGGSAFKGSPSPSVVLKKASLSEASPTVWELQETGDRQRAQVKKEAWQLKRYEHLLNLLKEGLIDHADFQAHKKPIVKYMANTCSEPGKENKELEHDKLVFLKQLKEAQCLTSSEYRLAKAPILRRLAGYRILSPSRDKKRGKGGFKAMLNKLKAHGLRHNSPPRSAMSSPCGSPPRGYKWKSASNPYFTHSEPIPMAPSLPKNVLKRMASTAPFPVQTYSLAQERQENLQEKSDPTEESASPSQELSGSPNSIRSPLDWHRRKGQPLEEDKTPILGTAAMQKGSKVIASLDLASDSRGKGAFGSEFQVLGDGSMDRSGAPGRMPGSESFDAGSSSRAPSSDRTSSGVDSEFSGDQSINGFMPNPTRNGASQGNRDKDPNAKDGAADAEETDLPNGRKSNYPSRFLLALHSSGEFGGFTNPFSQPPLSEELLDSPCENERELQSDIDASPEEPLARTRDPLKLDAHQHVPRAQDSSDSSLITDGDSMSRAESGASPGEETPQNSRADARLPSKEESRRGGTTRANLFGRDGGPAHMAAGKPALSEDGFGSDVFVANPVIKAGPPKKLQNTSTFPPASDRQAARPKSRPNSPPARPAPAVPRPQMLPSSMPTTQADGEKPSKGLVSGTASESRKGIPVAPSLAAKKPIPNLKVTTKINVAEIAVARQSTRAHAAKQLNVWDRLTGQTQGGPRKKGAGGPEEKAGLLDKADGASGDEGGSSMLPNNKKAQHIREAVPTKLPLPPRGRVDAHRPAANQATRTERSGAVQKQPKGGNPAPLKPSLLKGPRSGRLHIVPESPAREDAHRLEETESEAFDEVLFEDESREEGAESAQEAKGNEEKPPLALQMPAALEARAEEKQRKGHERRPSQEMHVPAGVFDEPKLSTERIVREVKEEVQPKQNGQRHERKGSQEMQLPADVFDQVDEAPSRPPVAAPPKTSAVAGKLQALQRQASVKHARKPSREEIVAEATVETVEVALEAPVPAPRGGEERAARHERKKSRDWEPQAAHEEVPAVTQPSEQPARHERKKSRDLASEEKKTEMDAGSVEQEAKEMGGPAKVATKATEEKASVAETPKTAQPRVLAEQPAETQAPAPAANAASSRLADLKARMANMRAGPKPGAAAVPPAPQVAPPAPAPTVSQPVPGKLPASEKAKAPPKIEPKAAEPVVVVEAVQEVVEVAVKSTPAAPPPAVAPSAKLDVAARVAARMAARAQAGKAGSVTPPSAPQASVTPPAASTEAASREGQLEATPEGAAIGGQATAGATVSKPNIRSISMPNKAPRKSEPFDAEEDLEDAHGSARAAGFATAPSSPRGQDAGREFPSPGRASRSQPSSPSSKLAAMRRQVSTLGSAAKPPQDKTSGAAATATRAWPGIKRGKEAPVSFARSRSQGSDNGTINESSKDDALAFTENIKKSFARLRMEKSQQKTANTPAAKGAEVEAPVPRGIDGALHETSRNTPATWARVNRLKDGLGPKGGDVGKGVRVSGATWQEEMAAAMAGKYTENISPEVSAAVDNRGYGDNLRKLR